MIQSLVLYDREFDDLLTAARALCNTASARAVFLVDRDGQLLVTAGDGDTYDALSIASLTAGNMAATDGLARLLGENEFGELYHQGENDHIHISCVGGRILQVVIFDHRSSLGLVRLRVKQSAQTVIEVLKRIESQTGAGPDELAGLSVSEIDALLDEE